MTFGDSIRTMDHTAYEAELEQIVEAARQAARHAYAPYSRFPVGAALLAADGEVFRGCNIENASYGLSICAERAALFNAVSSGARRFRAIAIFTPTSEPTPPCGACRQALSEFEPDLVVLSACAGGPTMRWILRDLFPVGFGLDAPSSSNY